MLAERLSRGLAAVPVENGLLLRGSWRSHVFRGRAAVSVLPVLLPLLDGSTGPEELCARTGLRPRELERVLGVLRARGLLESSDPPKRGRAPAHVRDYFSRTMERNGPYAGSGPLLDHLASVAVHVVGAAAAAAAVAEDLRECGVGLVTHAPTLPADIPRGAARTLVVALATPGDPDLVERTVARCAPDGLLVLRAFATPEHCEIGPCFVPGYTACPRCLNEGRTMAGWDDAAAESGAAADVLAGLTAGQALALVSGSLSVAPARTVTRVGLGDGETERHLLTPVPGCGCAGGAFADGPVTDGPGSGGAAEVYEWSQEAPPPAVRPQDPPGHVVDRWMEEARERTISPGRPFRALPRDERPVPGVYGAEDPDRTAAEPLDGALLARLLRRVAGLRGADGEPYQRWAPSAGGLGSVELRVVVGPGVAGAPSGVHRYEDLKHGLTTLLADEVPLADVLAGTGLDATRYDAVLVLVAAHRRIEQKYQGFAYRLAHLDAGCAAAQLAAVAAGSGLAAEFAARWGEDLHERLDLVPQHEYVTAVAGVRKAGR